jgi:hypothetical protein
MGVTFNKFLVARQESASKYPTLHTQTVSQNNVSKKNL